MPLGGMALTRTGAFDPSQPPRIRCTKGKLWCEGENGREAAWLALGHFSGEGDSPFFQPAITSSRSWVKITGSHKQIGSVRHLPAQAGWGVSELRAACSSAPALGLSPGEEAYCSEIIRQTSREEGSRVCPQEESRGTQTLPSPDHSPG